MKRVWITSLDRDEAQVQTLMGTVKRYGMEPAGHFWVDDVQKMAWNGPLDEITNSDTAMWWVVGKPEAIGAESVRVGLSLLAIAVHARRGLGFPVWVLPSSGEVQAESLPTVFRGADVVPVASTSLGPKMAAAAHMPQKDPAADYRLSVHAIPGIGIWFEVGPSKGKEWSGALFGVDSGDLNSHAVGPLGALPERAVLEYPMKGLKISSGGRDYTAWAVRNHLGDLDSYFIRAMGSPTALVFGQFPEQDEADLFQVSLK